MNDARQTREGIRIHEPADFAGMHAAGRIAAQKGIEAQQGFVDETLEKLRRARHIAVTVPNFMMGLTILAESDLVGALPRRLAVTYGARFGLQTAELPLPVTLNDICLVVPKSALMDAGIAWLYDSVFESFQRATGDHDMRR